MTCRVIFLSGLQVGGDADVRNLVALATTDHVLLLDCRRPREPLLQWSHGLDASPPTFVVLLCSPVAEEPAQDPVIPDPGLRTAAMPVQRGTKPPDNDLRAAEAFSGLITVCSLARGDALTLPFVASGIGEGRPQLAARHAAPAEASSRSRRRTALGDRFPGQVTATALVRRTAGSGSAGSDGAGADPDPPAFAWSPLLSAVYRAGLPWRVCRPLGRGTGDGTAALHSLRPHFLAARNGADLLDLLVRVQTHTRLLLRVLRRSCPKTKWTMAALAGG